MSQNLKSPEVVIGVLRVKLISSSNRINPTEVTVYSLVFRINMEEVTVFKHLHKIPSLQGFPSIMSILRDSVLC